MKIAGVAILHLLGKEAEDILTFSENVACIENQKTIKLIQPNIQEYRHRCMKNSRDQMCAASKCLLQNSYALWCIG